jgi:glycosyltransferase A (GT-A) superfamily protein (DUF2064 family)
MAYQSAMKSDSPALILFSNNPVTDGSRKRLLSNQSDNIHLHQSLLFHILDVVNDACAHSSFDVYIASDFLSEKEKTKISDVLQQASQVNFLKQQGHTFKQRLLNTFDSIHTLGYDKIVIIGSDSPDITSEMLHKAFADLEESSLTIGPSADGGVYLIGMSEYHPEVLKNISWCTSSVLKQLIFNSSHSYNSITLLPVLIDIDNKDQLTYWLSVRSGLLSVLQSLLEMIVLAKPHFNRLNHIPFVKKKHFIKRAWQKAPPKTF